MGKAWLNSYPASVPSEIDPARYSSIPELLARSCARFPRRPAFRNFGTTLTYRQLDRLSRDFAAWLGSLPGLGKGSRVAIMLPNLLQYPVAMFGALRAGMIVVNVNPLYTARELDHQLRDSGAEAVVILENFAHVLERVLAGTAVRYVVTTQIGDLIAPPRRWLVNFTVKRVKKLVPAWRIEGAIPFPRALHLGSRLPFEEPAAAPTAIAFLQYTGGTTGVSKGAILTHGNVVANVLQADAWAGGNLEEGREIVVAALPLYHIFSLTVNCLLFMKLAGMNLLITNPRDMAGLVKELARSHFTAITGVNALFSGLVNTPGFGAVDFSRLKVAIAGGAAVHPSVAERWLALTGCHLMQGYGLTEASPLVTCSPPGLEFDARVGVPMPSTDVAILDEQNHELPPGAEGEICVRGPQVMQGYWQSPEETRRAFAPGGWLRTGDMGAMDEQGYLRITDRKKDMILVSGFNVYPNEVECVLTTHPDVLECAVIGVPDAIGGEVVKAYIVSRDPSLTPEAVIAHCRRHLTNYMVPKLIEFRDALPKNPVGKVLRRELRRR